MGHFVMSTIFGLEPKFVRGPALTAPIGVQHEIPQECWKSVIVSLAGLASNVLSGLAAYILLQTGLMSGVAAFPISIFAVISIFFSPLIAGKDLQNIYRVFKYGKSYRDDGQGLESASFPWVKGVVSPSEDLPDLEWWKNPSNVHVVASLSISSLCKEQQSSGIGEYPDLARFFREVLQPLGVDVVLLLPFFASLGSSPYASICRYSLEELNICWQDAVAMLGLDIRIIDDLLIPDAPADIDFAAVRQRKEKAAEMVYREFCEKHLVSGTEKAQEFNAFMNNNPWLADYAEFASLHHCIGRNSLTWEASDIASVMADDEFKRLFATHCFSQWIAYQQCAEVVAEIKGLGGKLLFDVPIYCGKDSVEVWRNPGYFRDVQSVCPGVVRPEENLAEAWGDLAVWNWHEAARDNFSFILDVYAYWFTFGFDGVRCDGLHHVYPFQGKLDAYYGDLPGDAYVEKLAGVIARYNAVPLAEAYEQKDNQIRRFGFLAVGIDWRSVSTHDDPRRFEKLEEFTAALSEEFHDNPYERKHALFVQFTLGDERGDRMRYRGFDYVDAHDQRVYVLWHGVPTPFYIRDTWKNVFHLEFLANAYFTGDTLKISAAQETIFDMYGHEYKRDGVHMVIGWDEQLVDVEGLELVLVNERGEPVDLGKLQSHANFRYCIPYKSNPSYRNRVRFDASEYMHNLACVLKCEGLEDRIRDFVHVTSAACAGEILYYGRPGIMPFTFYPAHGAVAALSVGIDDFVEKLAGFVDNRQDAQVQFQSYRAYLTALLSGLPGSGALLDYSAMIEQTPLHDFDKTVALLAMLRILKERLIEKIGESQSEMLREEAVVISLQNRLARATELFIDRDDPLCNPGVVTGIPHFDRRQGADFYNWGRDTMISLPGIFLVTARYDSFRTVFSTYIRFVKNGILPNFIGDGTHPEYNSVDATLWMFWALGEYLKQTGDYNFLKTCVARVFPRQEDETIQSILEECFGAYRDGVVIEAKGLASQVYMDSDGLIMSGTADTQLTWMDAQQCGEKPVTPRWGKAVEINALWYRALQVMGGIAAYQGDSQAAGAYEKLSFQVKTSFEAEFWNAAGGYLYDTVDGDAVESLRLRPNQVWALAFGLLDVDKARIAVTNIKNALLTPYGLRTLSPTDAAYCPQHHDEHTYHQGTVWPWLSGGFIEGYMRVFGRRETIRMLTEYHYFDGIRLQVDNEHHCLAEVFDGACQLGHAYNGYGCHSQAWSVAENLRGMALLMDVGGSRQAYP